jgi:hypothetical protein
VARSFKRPDNQSIVAGPRRAAHADIRRHVDDFLERGASAQVGHPDRRRGAAGSTRATGVSPGNADQSGAFCRIAAMVSESVSRAKAARPVSISYNTQPNAQMSACDIWGVGGL